MTSKPAILISPSILAADFSKLADEINQVMDAGADTIHFDVMDNNFVPNLSFGAPILESLRKSRITAYIDVHLMCERVDNLIDDFAKAGANAITIHYERDVDLIAELKKIKSLGMHAGIAIKPNTPASVVEQFLPLVDLVLVMTVEPGFGGQKFMPDMMPKVEQVKAMIDQYKLIDSRPIQLQVDGGISQDTIAIAAQAGANNFVAGSAIFAKPNYKIEVSQLKKLGTNE